MMKESAAEELTRQWGRLTLREDENPGIVIKPQTFSPLIQRGQSCMVGKLLSERTITKEVLKIPMVRAWKPTGSVTFRTLGPNLFVIDFQKWWDKDRILEGRPWTFDGDLFSLLDFDGLTPIGEMEFENAAFWVRMYKLPLACMGREVALQVGATVGEVEDVDVLDDGVGWGEYLRVKIRLDLTKPLSKRRIIKVQENDLWVAFQYEKIPRFCFTCGTVVHCSKRCGEYGGRKVQRAEGSEDFGPWLRVASPNKRTNQRAGWTKNRTRERVHADFSGEEPTESHSWRLSGRGGDAGRKSHELLAKGGTTAGNEGQKGLSTTCTKFPNLAMHDRGKGIMEGPELNDDFIADQDLPSEEEGDGEGMQLNRAVSDMEGDVAGWAENHAATDMEPIFAATGKEAQKDPVGEEKRAAPEISAGDKVPQTDPAGKENQADTPVGLDFFATNKVTQTDPAGGENQVEGFADSMFPAKEVTHKTSVNAEENKREGTNGRKSGNVYVGQWNQVKKQMEWNIMEGNKEDFCPTVDATSPMKEAIQSANPRGTHKKANLGRTQPKVKRKAGHVNNSGPRRKIVEKKREYAAGPAAPSPGSSPMQPILEMRPNNGWKRTRTTKEESSYVEKHLAEAAVQPRQSQ
jgi:hypothetical protein